MFCLLMVAVLLSPLDPDGTRFEGTVGVEGSEPFTLLVLYVDEDERYVLDVDKKDRMAIQAGLPGRIAVIGTLSEEATPAGVQKRIAVKDWHWLEKSGAEN